MVMDLFNVLEEKLETALKQFEDLKKANGELKKSLDAKDQTLKEAQAAMEKITREREMVRQRVDKILERLKILDTGEKA